MVAAVPLAAAHHGGIPLLRHHHDGQVVPLLHAIPLRPASLGREESYEQARGHSEVGDDEVWRCSAPVCGGG
jgi:hypothetical protein